LLLCCLLQSAKLYALSFDHQMAQKTLASVKLQIRHVSQAAAATPACVAAAQLNISRYWSCQAYVTTRACLVHGQWGSSGLRAPACMQCLVAEHADLARLISCFGLLGTFYIVLHC
jgi:hypothetical protein